MSQGVPGLVGVRVGLLNFPYFLNKKGGKRVDFEVSGGRVFCIRIVGKKRIDSSLVGKKRIGFEFSGEKKGTDFGPSGEERGKEEEGRV